jgi:hypothetical protein
MSQDKNTLSEAGLNIEEQYPFQDPIPIPLDGEWAEIEENLVTPAVPYQRSFRDWFYWRIWRNPLLEPRNDRFAKLEQDRLRWGSLGIYDWVQADEEAHYDRLNDDPWFFRAFFGAYEIDGYDFSTNLVTCADHPEPILLERSHISIWLILSAFLGMPNRPAAVWDGEKFIPKLTGMQFLKNWIGGWSDPKRSKSEQENWWGLREKAWWEILFSLFKFSLVPLSKLLVVLCKTPINVIKLFTEILLPLIVVPLINFLLKLALIIPYNFCLLLTRKISPFFFNFVDSKSEWSRVLIYILASPIILILSIPLILKVLVKALGRLSVIVARAALSPEKSARMALNYGRELEGEIWGIKIGNIVGGLGATLSVAITVVAWILLFPLAVGAIAEFFPFVSQMVLGILQWPILGASVGAIQGALTSVGSGLAVLFGPAITVISTFLSIQLPAALVAFAMTIGMISAVVVPLLSRGVDELSHQWMSRHEGGPITFLARIISKLREDLSSERGQFVELKEILEPEKDEVDTYEPGSEVQSLVENEADELTMACRSSDSLDDFDLESDFVQYEEKEDDLSLLLESSNISSKRK